MLSMGLGIKDFISFALAYSTDVSVGINFQNDYDSVDITGP